MEKKELTIEQILDGIRYCKTHTFCSGCPIHTIGYCDKVEIFGRLADAYDEKCKELKEWKESHAALVKDVEERGEENEKLKEQVLSVQDQYKKSREECDMLHKEINSLELEVAVLKLRLAANATGTSAKEAANSTAVLGLTCKVTGLEAENKKLKEENEELKTANAHLLQLRDEYREAMPVLTEANNKLKEENEELKKKYDIRNADYEKVFREASYWNHRYEVMKTEHEICKNANNVLKEKVAQFMKNAKVEVMPVDDDKKIRELADFWKGQYEATKKVLDEERVTSAQLRKEIANHAFKQALCRDADERQKKEKAKKLADKISDIIYGPYMYKIPIKRKYTDKDVDIAVSECLTGFRQSVHNEIGKCLEEFYGK